MIALFEGNAREFEGFVLAFTVIAFLIVMALVVVALAMFLSVVTRIWERMHR